MITIAYRLAATSRLSAGAGPEVQNSRTVHSILPGSTIRGALATAYAAERNFDWQLPDIRTMFGDAVRFSQAVPDTMRLWGMSEAVCKYPTPTCPPKGQPHVDFAQVIAEDREPPPERCPACGGAWTTQGGWALPEGAEGLHGASTRVELVGGVAKSGNLFTRRSIKARTGFTGTLWVDETRLTSDQVTWLTDRHAVRLGGQRSVLGAATWTAERTELDAGQPVADQTILRCVSPTILLDQFGAPTLDPADAFREALGADTVIVARWVRGERVAGWHMASGLAKPEDWALAAGSTFVVENAPGDTAARLRPGLGLRLPEGYGEFVVVRPLRNDAPTTEPERRVEAADVERLAAVLSGDEPAPAAPVAAETPPAPDPDQQRYDDVAGALGALLQPTPKAGFQGLLGALTQIRNYRQNGFPSSIVAPLTRNALNTPWARALPPTISEQVRVLLDEADVGKLAASYAEIRRRALDKGVQL